AGPRSAPASWVGPAWSGSARERGNKPAGSDLGDLGRSYSDLGRPSGGLHLPRLLPDRHVLRARARERLAGPVAPAIAGRPAGDAGPGVALGWPAVTERGPAV